MGLQGKEIEWSDIKGDLCNWKDKWNGVQSGRIGKEEQWGRTIDAKGFDSIKVS